MAETTSGFTLQLPAAPPNRLQAAGELLRSTLMRRDGPQLQVALGGTHAWSFEVRRHPMKLQVLEGEVMVTFEGDPMDHVLAQGALFTTPRHGRVAVAAFRPSRFSVTAA
jgi:hypothetical protein